MLKPCAPTRNRRVPGPRGAHRTAEASACPLGQDSCRFGGHWENAGVMNVGTLPAFRGWQPGCYLTYVMKTGPGSRMIDECLLLGTDSGTYLCCMWDTGRFPWCCSNITGAAYRYRKLYTTGNTTSSPLTATKTQPCQWTFGIIATVVHLMTSLWFLKYSALGTLEFNTEINAFIMNYFPFISPS